MSKKNYKYDRARLADPGYKGDDYEVDDKVGDGPLEDRSCTDILFCIIFLAFLGGFGIVSLFGYQNGKPDRLLAPLDGNGRFCGIDNEVKSYSYLYLVLDPLEATTISDLFQTAVCVNSCPKNDSADIQCVNTNSTPDCNKFKSPFRYDSTLVFKRACLPSLKDLNPQLQEKYQALVGALGVSDIGQGIQDIMESWEVYIIALFTTFIVTLIYLFMVKQCAGIIVWLSILIGIGGLIGGGFYLSDYQTKLPEDGSSTKTWVKYGSYACWTAGAIFSLLVLCLFNSIRVATAVMKTSAVFIAQNMRTILVPLFAFVFAACFLTFWVIDAAYLASSGEIKASKNIGGQWRELVWDDTLRYFVIYLFFGLLWILAMIISCTQFIVIVAACVWYFTSTSDTRGKASLLKGMHWMFRYNFGSLAFGSLLLALVWFAIIVFEYIQKKLNGQNGELQNPVTKFITCCCRCCLQCCHRFIKFLNKNAFVQVALNCTNFCASAMNAFLLVLKNSGTFMVSEGIAGIFMFLGKIFISVANTAICYLILTNWEELSSKVNSPIGPLIAVFIISYVIASVFMALFSIASTTIVQCFLTDVELSRGNGGDGTDGRRRPRELDYLVHSLTKKSV